MDEEGALALWEKTREKIAKHREKSPEVLSDREIDPSFRQSYLPYILRMEDDGSYVVLNRSYNTIGWPAFWDIAPGLARTLSIKNSPSISLIHLYDDVSTPNQNRENMNIYLRKLGLLMCLGTGEDPLTLARKLGLL